MEAALWGPSRLGGAGIPKAGQSAGRALDGHGLGTGLRAFLPTPEVCSVAQRVSTPPVPLMAAPLPPARNCLLFEGVGEQTPHGNVSPTPGSQEPLPQTPTASLAAQRHILCLAAALPLLQAGPHSGSGTPGFMPPRGGNPRPPCPACMTIDLGASLTSNLTGLPPTDPIP